MKTYGRRRLATAEPEIVNLDEICRLCLGREERDEYRVPIFTQDDPVPLALRIMACVALEVLEDDGLPNTICRPCHYQLQNYYIFRKKCKSSDIKLRMHLKQLADSGRASNVKVEDDKSESSIMAANEQELVGASVTIAIPEEDEVDMDLDGEINELDTTNDITLPQDTPNDSRQACTLKQELLEEEDKDDDRQSTINKNSKNIDEDFSNTHENTTKKYVNTVSNGDENDESMSVRVVANNDSSLTHVEVTTEDGSVLLMELTEEPVPEKNEAGEFLIFKCDQCPKAFARKVELRRHSSVHASQRGITCNVCEKWFPSNSSYSRHERIHTGDKPYHCGICNRRFVQKEVLLRHILIHSDVKPFNCMVCKKGFTQREALKVHMTTKHTSEQRPVQLHKCPLCTKVFCHASGLSRHLTVHTGRVFKCLDCDTLFSDKSSLRRHHRASGHQSLN